MTTSSVPTRLDWEGHDLMDGLHNSLFLTIPSTKCGSRKVLLSLDIASMESEISSFRQYDSVRHVDSGVLDV